jgi:hypothetical protein
MRCGLKLITFFHEKNLSKTYHKCTLSLMSLGLFQLPAPLHKRLSNFSISSFELRANSTTSSGHFPNERLGPSKKGKTGENQQGGKNEIRSNNRQHTKGTSSPRCIISVSCLPLSDPEATSSRRRSPD